MFQLIITPSAKLCSLQFCCNFSMISTFAAANIHTYQYPATFSIFSIFSIVSCFALLLFLTSISGLDLFSPLFAWPSLISFAIFCQANFHSDRHCYIFPVSPHIVFSLAFPHSHNNSLPWWASSYSQFLASLTAFHRLNFIPRAIFHCESHSTNSTHNSIFLYQCNFSPPSHPPPFTAIFGHWQPSTSVRFPQDCKGTSSTFMSFSGICGTRTCYGWTWLTLFCGHIGRILHCHLHL